MKMSFLHFVSCTTQDQHEYHLDDARLRILGLNEEVLLLHVASLYSESIPESKYYFVVMENRKVVMVKA
jgi:hypothetical protein